MARRGYGQNFYASLAESSRASAQVVVPLLTALIGVPDSVVDIGCGSGAWVRTFADAGVDDYLGIDGGDIEPAQLLIPLAHFRRLDLAKEVAVDRTFDLAVCLEVAEHLPEHRADRFIDELTALSTCVLFSAAIPYQGGVHHVNEQWPDYWVDKFAAKGYVGLDPFRMALWDDAKVDYWFAQNLLLFVAEEELAERSSLRGEFDRTGGRVPALVHPRTYSTKAHVATTIMKVVPQPLIDLLKRKVFQRPGQDANR